MTGGGVVQLNLGRTLEVLYFVRVQHRFPRVHLEIRDLLSLRRT